uniref:SAND domain-containing protein n=1 Tax=Oryza glaberrima TaxID=4538 RepID=I1PX16_ORYGL
MAVENGAALFGEEELRDVSGVRVGDRFVEVTCGCTSARYGDAVGRLRLFASGELQVSCDCTPGCDQDKLSPAAFEKHSGRETAGRWQNTVWVMVKGDKVALSKTCLLRYYHKKLKSSSANGGGRRPPCHRDEFVRCAGCGKERRFRLRTKEECRLYHDAMARHDWTCKDMPPAGRCRVRVSCEEEEERASRKASRGCTRAATCKGCVRTWVLGRQWHSMNVEAVASALCTFTCAADRDGFDVRTVVCSVQTVQTYRGVW